MLVNCFSCWSLILFLRALQCKMLFSPSGVFYRSPLVGRRCLALEGLLGIIVVSGDGPAALEACELLLRYVSCLLRSHHTASYPQKISADEQIFVVLVSGSVNDGRIGSRSSYIFLKM